MVLTSFCKAFFDIDDCRWFDIIGFQAFDSTIYLEKLQFDFPLRFAFTICRIIL